MDIDKLKRGLVIRIKNFKTRDNMPDHWGSDMLKFSNEVFRISGIEHFSEEDDGTVESDHIHLTNIIKEKPRDIEGYYFFASDFQKVNTLNVRKSKSSS